MNNIEIHPLPPFLHRDSKILLLGSFPPKKEKWKMNFYYPNFINDMWRILGIVFFNDKHYFLSSNAKSFNVSKIQSFLLDKKIAIADSAVQIRRLKDNASDKYLEVLESLNFDKVLDQIPNCSTIISTGQKSSELICEYFKLSAVPDVGSSISFKYHNRIIKLYRAPSSSRAYPLSIEKKSEIYQSIFFNI